MSTFNGAQYVKEQIESILNQKGVKLELYISDDCSTDETGSIVHSYSNLTNCHLLVNKKKHGAAGKNFFSMMERVNFDKFDFVAFADQDDIWNRDKLLKSVAYMAEVGNCVGVSSCVEAFWADGRRLFVDKSDKQKKYDYIFEAAGPGCTYLFTAAFANEIKSLLMMRPWIYSSVFSHDWLVYAYARAMGYGWHIFPFSTLLYRQHGANETGVNIGANAAKNRLKKLKSGWYLDQVYAVARAAGYENELTKLFPSRGAPSFFFYMHFLEMRRRFFDAVLMVIFFIFRVTR